MQNQIGLTVKACFTAMILNMVFFSLGPLNATEVEQETVKSSGYFTNETDSGLGSIWDDIYALLPPTDGGSEMDVILKQIEWKHNLFNIGLRLLRLK
mmetsp:Transcript_29023/g.40082  ORF Transcript_29023/g.40082 Transcript_29023/m.40082 type:complete len:97 (-) Transcript_29023:144-434(-)